MLEDRDFFVIEAPGDAILNEVFSTAQPLYLEIGSGKGEFISRYPTMYPEHNFLGIEMSEKRIKNCLRKLNPERNPNVRLLRRYVDSSIQDWFLPHSIHGVFIQHPDPWPKRRHHRRRLIQQDFLNALAEILNPAAQVQISTDHLDYAQWIVDEFAINPYYVSLQNQPLQSTPNLDAHVPTWFEETQKKSGFQPHYMLYKCIKERSP